MKTALRFVVCTLAVATFAVAEEKVDLESIYRIKQEAFQNSKVMDHLFYLTDVHGPRLAGSPRYKASAEWAVKTLKDWGIDNARLDTWGSFGKGWENKKFVAAMTEPAYMPLIGSAQAWTSSTEGVLSGEPIIAVLSTDADLEKWKGKLAGKIVLTDAVREIALHDKADGHRYTDQELAEIETAQIGPSAMMRRAAGPGQPNFAQMMAFRRKLNDFFREEKVGLLISSGMRGDFGTYFTSNGGPRDAKSAAAPPMVVLTGEHYNRIYRLVEKQMKVKLEFDIQNQWYEPDQNNFNVIAEIPGTGKHKDEIVMIGGHLDSWHSGTGATDNGASAAVMMEVARIIKALGVRPARTIRFALWDGEEHGLLGSKAYVEAHYGSAEAPKPGFGELVAYVNMDGGAGQVRGLTMFGPAQGSQVLRELLAPFQDLGVRGASATRNRPPKSLTGPSTDMSSFTASGLPAIGVVQDGLEYFEYTWHTAIDTLDRVPPEDVKRTAAVLASVAIHLAQRPERLPFFTKATLPPPPAEP